MIEKLDVQNFTALPNATWSFTPGLNVVVGENGLGKTHVLKLLCTLLKVQADAKVLSKSVLERAYAEKLTAVFRPESLERLVKRRQGRARCEFRLTGRLAIGRRNCGPPELRPQERRRFTMKTIQTARHAAHASAHDHPGRFYAGLVVAALGTGLWLAEVARMLIGQ